MTYKLRFLYAAKAAHPAGAVFATLRLADFCLALTASQTLIRGSLRKEESDTLDAYENDEFVSALTAERDKEVKPMPKIIQER